MRISDWSSDVCSSDLQQPQPQILRDVGVLTLFQKNPDVLKSYQAQFRYLLVDEYQDTNVAQYLWLRLLAQGHRNICCVGGDDQSSYGWRGSEVGNILDRQSVV